MSTEHGQVHRPHAAALPERHLVAASTDGSCADVVIVDDDRQNARLLERVLRRAGYEEVSTINDASEALARCHQRSPDLLVLDLHMPTLDGLAVLAGLKALRDREGHFPVIVLTGDVSAEARLSALTAGADDFLTKPVDALETALRVRTLLTSHLLRRSLIAQRGELQQTVRARTRELQLAHAEILEHLALAAEYRDDATHRHATRIGELAADIAGAAGLDAELVELIAPAATLHDVGKLAVPDAILTKPGPLDPDERSVMQEHTTRGAEILAGSRSPLIRLAEKIARSHHERWDGDGYPQRLAGDQIPQAARVVAIADVFDALTHERPYKRAWSIEAALVEMRNAAGTPFDPDLLGAFLQLDHRAFVS